MSTTPTLLDANLFVRYLSREVTDSERLGIANFLKTHLAHAELVAQLCTLPESVEAESAQEAIDIERAVAEFFARIETEQITAQRTPTTSEPFMPPRPRRGFNLVRSGVRKSVFQRALWATVAVAVLIGVTAIGWKAGMWQMRQQVATSALIYTTANAQRADITLPDGSVVALDVGSRLTVPSDYAAGHHTVRLTGKGMFTVQRHDGTPFTVLAGPALVHVLGTSFVVRHYPTDSLATVAVRSGKVSVGETVVAASQQVAVGVHGAGVVHAMDPGQFSFVRGVLVLNAIPMHQAIVELDRWYDVDIRLGDPSLAARHIAGEYAAGSLADLSDILMGSLGVRVERRGRVLTLYPR